MKRQEYGFAMYLPNEKDDYITSGSGFDLHRGRLRYQEKQEMDREKGREPKKNLLENVKYSKLVSDFKET